jgi:hypothetical protein
MPAVSRVHYIEALLDVLDLLSRLTKSAIAPYEVEKMIDSVD